jgi:hypothetical protein
MVHEDSPLQGRRTLRRSSLSFGSWKTIRPPLQQISRCTFKCIAKFIQNIGPVALVASIKKRLERWLGDTGFLLKLVTRPAFLFQQFL